jgi:hypothetical protein
MRHAADMRPIGGGYFDDGFGNLIGFGTFTAPKLGGASRYALTFRKNGGMQLALDFRDDAVVDMLLELAPDGRLGALADPDTQWLLDCLARERAAGANLVAAANHCLGSPGGGGGGLGRGAELEADRLKEPDCEERGGVPGSVTQGGGGSVEIPLANGDTIHATETQNDDGTTTTTVVIVDSQGRVVYSERTTSGGGRPERSETTRVTYHETGGSRVETERREDGRVVESSSIDVPGGLEIEIGEAILETPGLEIEIGDAIIEWVGPRRGGGTGPTRQPGPECEDCPVEDPRCAPAPNDIASLWDCQAETDMSLWKCLENMRDVIYTATGGRCAVEPGPDDRPMIRCSDRELMKCLQEGGAVLDCLRQSGFAGDAESIGPENDDFLRGRYGDSRGQAGLYIDSTPMGAVFLALCAEGLEQLCRGGGRF